MALSIFNTLSRKKEDFRPLKKGQVTLYSCGPTVYNFAHIGNFRAYMTSDILKRYLEYSGYDVRHIMNITDVDDKTIRDSKKEGVSLKKFCDRYEKAFFEDLKTLNIEPADVFPRATESVPEMVKLINILLDKGIAYKTHDGIYFKISKFKDYGKLSKIDLSERKAGSRVASDEYDKESVHDFALWKFWTPDDGDVFWETDIGKGRPGWHIECSAMSMENIGESIDIHSGGVDLIFPHHENEIAQSEAATGKPFVKYWFHNEYILVDGKKMSKSLGNFFTLRDILKKGYRPKAIRYLLLSANYRQPLNFTFEGLDAAQNAVDRLMDFMDSLDSAKGKIDSSEIDRFLKDAMEGFSEEMDNDLNISGALAKIFELVKEVNRLELSKKDASRVRDAMMRFDKVLGILEKEKIEIPEDVLKLVEEREKARKAKDFRAADSARDKVMKLGFSIDDTPDGPKLRKN